MTDLILNNDNDLQIIDDDLLTGFSQKQQQQILLIAEPGSIKQYPNVGVGVGNFFESEKVQGLLAEIRNQFTADGITINSLAVVNGKIKIDGNYQDN